jgi:transaldolase/glucose-6-phosphate isomerase
MGTAAKLGRDKITLIASPGISDLGAWLEQLIAESTGKLGKGIIPVDREALGAPDVYGNDRSFAYLRLEGASDAAQDAKVAALEKAGHPVVRIAVADTYAWGRNSSAGRLPLQLRDPSSASTPSISPMSKRARSSPSN